MPPPLPHIPCPDLEAESINHLLCGINGNSKLKELTSDPGIFPLDTWRALADRGLLRRFSPASAEQQNTASQTTFGDIAQAGYAIARHYQGLGLTMTWVGQLLKARFLHTLSFHDTDYIKNILDGESLCALAISEHGVGAHPKHLSCTATRDRQHYILNGEKAFVSNGPYADQFIVLAITEQKGSRKYYSAFLVPADNEGLILSPPQAVNSLQPSSHCNIVLTECRVPTNALIGTPGRAFEEISLPMRALEDSLMLAPIAGAMQAQLDYIAQSGIADESKSSQQVKGNPSRIDHAQLGKLLCLTASAKELGIIAAGKLDQQTSNPDLTPIIIGFRVLVKAVQEALFGYVDDHSHLQTLAGDIQILTSIGQKATQARAASLAAQFLATHKQNN